MKTVLFHLYKQHFQRQKRFLIVGSLYFIFLLQPHHQPSSYPLAEIQSVIYFFFLKQINPDP